MALLQFKGCYFFISLLRDDIPYTSDLGNTVIINHNFCSEPILKKLLYWQRQSQSLGIIYPEK